MFSVHDPKKYSWDLFSNLSDFKQVSQILDFFDK